MSTPEPAQRAQPAQYVRAASSESTGQPVVVPAPASAPGTEPFVSLHTAVVLLAAVVIGLVIATLTVLSGAHPATAAITGLTAAGAGTGVLRNLIR
ncbi:hypothetical protein MUK60_01990 [Streptomyces sp. LRE541]|uniref:hypothetical protein n=1 Tax=Streptomyces sp. LRE541 TaxID=2931983 RepID=UPI00200D0B0F|nr:hypothetical protein [Streptomyces sp. LRE541]UPZ26687.1 hypothetical protein MUK60_01990 [Streptomyces sp. LRE541]